MEAFRKSAYGDDSVAVLVSKFTKDQHAARLKEEAEVREHSERGEFVREKQNSTRRAYKVRVVCCVWAWGRLELELQR